jgi:hypothetical protein
VGTCGTAQCERLLDTGKAENLSNRSFAKGVSLAAKSERLAYEDPRWRVCFYRIPMFASDDFSNRFDPIFPFPTALQVARGPMNECRKLGRRKGGGNGDLWVLADESRSTVYRGGGLG